jgi:hypothetical protein
LENYYDIYISRKKTLARVLECILYPKKFWKNKILKLIIMKKITLFVASLMLVASATKASTLINDAKKNLKFITRFSHDEPIEFNERGIQFYVFPNGEFDFNTQNENSQGGMYYKTAGRRSFEVNINLNGGVAIERDNFGRVRRVGNTFINYDFQDRVSRIGSVYMRYNRFALTQVGGLQIVYNRFGEIIDIFGQVKAYRNYQPYCNNNGHYNNGNHYGNNNNGYQSNDDYTTNDDYYYYYKQDGTREKISDKKEENSDENRSDDKKDRR